MSDFFWFLDFWVLGMQKGGRKTVLLYVWPHTSLPVSKGPVPSCRLPQDLIVGKAEPK